MANKRYTPTNFINDFDKTFELMVTEQVQGSFTVKELMQLLNDKTLIHENLSDYSITKITIKGVE